MSKDDEENFLADLETPEEEMDYISILADLRDDPTPAELARRLSLGPNAWRRAAAQRLNRISMHVAVRDPVGLALRAEPAVLLAPRPSSPSVEQVLVGDRLGADEALRQVGVDRARGVDRGRAVRDRPGADLVRARR